MPFLNRFQTQQLLENGSKRNRGKDHFPVSLLTFPYQCDAGVWLLTELYAERPNVAFGCVHEFGKLAEAREIDLTTLYNAQLHGQVIVFDYFFEGQHPLSIYVKAANEIGTIQRSGYDAKTLLKYKICTEQEVVDLELTQMERPYLQPFEAPNKGLLSPKLKS